MATAFWRIVGKPCQFLAFVPALMYVASFFVPAFELQFDVIETVAGWQAFSVFPRHVWESVREKGLFGLLALIYPGSIAGYGVLPEKMLLAFWMPNVLIPIGLVCLSTCRWRLAITLGVIAMILGVVPAAYFAGMGLFPQYFAGYFLWLGSMAGITVLGAIGRITNGPAGQGAATTNAAISMQPTSQ